MSCMRFELPGIPIKLRLADAAVILAIQGNPPRAIEAIFGKPNTYRAIVSALTRARRRGEPVPNFKDWQNGPREQRA